MRLSWTFWAPDRRFSNPCSILDELENLSGLWLQCDQHLDPKAQLSSSRQMLWELRSQAEWSLLFPRWFVALKSSVIRDAREKDQDQSWRNWVTVTVTWSGPNGPNPAFPACWRRAMLPLMALMIWIPRPLILAGSFTNLGLQANVSAMERLAKYSKRGVPFPANFKNRILMTNLD